jgi:hypothetical protein
MLDQQVNMERRSGELLCRQRLQPVPNLWFQLDHTPGHSIDAICTRKRPDLAYGGGSQAEIAGASPLASVLPLARDITLR